jgi:hypothetical protein
VYTMGVYHGCLLYARLANSAGVYHRCLLQGVYHGCLPLSPFSLLQPLTFYWKELRSCNMALKFRLYLEQLIGYLSCCFFFLIFGFFF